MNDKRFEDWWVRNPAREALNPVAKEVARGVWRAARVDMAAEIQGTVAQTPDPTFKERSDALWVSQLGVVKCSCNADAAALIKMLAGFGEVREDKPTTVPETPWYPDNSGKWAEVPNSQMEMPAELKLSTEVAYLLRSEREFKKYRHSWLPANYLRWDLLAYAPHRIVAYKVVKT